jgi:hypothetical protein
LPSFLTPITENEKNAFNYSQHIYSFAQSFNCPSQKYDLDTMVFPITPDPLGMLAKSLDLTKENGEEEDP